MKKFAVFISLLLVFTTCIFTGCGKDDKTIRINEVTHSIFYAPLYVAINNGYFEDNGYTIELTNGGGSDKSMAALLNGSADVALMGPETVVYVADQGKKDVPQIFGQLTKRDGSFLVGRTAEPNFDWATSLQGKHVIAGRKGGSPAMSLQYAIEKNGLSITDDLNFDLSIAFNLTTSAFEGGTGDYCTMFEPTASEFVKKGYSIVASVGEEAGEIPFTCFMATPSYMENNPAKIEMFLKCIIKAYNFIMTAPINDVVNALKPSFEGSTDESIKASIESYKRIDAWCSSPVMTSDSFDRLKQMLVGAGELSASNTVTMNQCVNNTYALNVIS